jgi:hypothetical protein
MSDTKSPRTCAKEAAERVKQMRKKERQRLEEEQFAKEKAKQEMHHKPQTRQRVSPSPDVVRFSLEQARLQRERKEKLEKLQEMETSKKMEELNQTLKQKELETELNKRTMLEKLAEKREIRESSRHRSDPDALRRIKEFMKKHQQVLSENETNNNTGERESRSRQRSFTDQAGNVNPRASIFCIEQARKHKERQQKQKQLEEEKFKRDLELAKLVAEEKERKASIEKERMKNKLRNKRLNNKKYMETHDENEKAFERTKEYKNKVSRQKPNYYITSLT